MIRFRVNGIPAPQGSKRHVGNGRMVEMSKAVGPWREAVRADSRRAMYHESGEEWAFDDGFVWYPTGQPVAVTIVFVVSRANSHYSTAKGKRNMVKDSAPKYPAKRPDLDKLERAVLDGLVAGGVMADDSQVCAINSAKVYASNGEAPGALIEVEAM